MSRWRRTGESGFTLVEVLLASTLMLVVLSATLTSFNNFVNTNRRDEDMNDAQEAARTSLETIAAQIRNLASPTTTNVKTIDTASSYDFIFQTQDPAKQWVRYCLNDGTGSQPSFTGFISSTSTNERLWQQLPDAGVTSVDAAMRATCPADPATTGWSSARVVTSNVTNRIGGQDRPVFSFNGSPSTDTSTITYARSQLFVDTNTNKDPKETRVSTGEYLRNQNQPPVAIFTATQSHSNPLIYFFNGTQSSDPEGRTISSFFWYKGTGDTSLFPSCADSAHMTYGPTSGTQWTCMGSGATLNYTFPSTDSSPQTVYLKVTDPGGLANISPGQALPLTSP